MQEKTDIKMRSYIAIHNFLQKKPFPDVEEIKILINEAVESQKEKGRDSKDTDFHKKTENKSYCAQVTKLVRERMMEYNKLVGI